MNNNDHPSSKPLASKPPPYPSQNHGGSGPQGHKDSKQMDSQTRFEHGPPYKRPRNYDNNASSYYDNNGTNSVPFQPLNPRTSQPNHTGSRGTTSIFFKTRMCARFLAGTCPNGESCTFAHGSEELREPPPNWKDIIREKDRESGNWNDDHRIIHRERICRKFYNGEECPYGNSCNFLHESPSRFRSDVARAPPRESTAINIGKVGPVMEQNSNTNTGQAATVKHFNANTDAFQVNMTKPWRTKICSKWEIDGQCPFGDKCHFAHGHSELQVPGAHSESEIMTNAQYFSTKPQPQLLSDALATKAEAILPTQERVNNEVSPKWKLHKKITTIYGDWPEDLTPPESSRR